MAMIVRQRHRNNVGASGTWEIVLAIRFHRVFRRSTAALFPSVLITISLELIMQNSGMVLRMAVISLGVCIGQYPLTANTADDSSVPVAPRASHVHPSIARTKAGTLVVVCKGGEGLVAVRSLDDGATWDKPTRIETSVKRPESIREVKTFEVYPGTIDRLPDDRLLVTWNYIADDKKTDGYYERALLYSLSSDEGKSWSEQKLIGPLKGKHLGAVRHNVLTWSEGRWLLPLRVGPPLLFDPAQELLSPFRISGPEQKPHSFQQIVRTPKGTLLAMGPQFLRSGDDGVTWTPLEGFPAVPDGDSAEGRYLTVLRDGRLVVTWGVGLDNKGLRYNVSKDEGESWSSTVTILPQTGVAARYYSARSVELNDKEIGTVFVGNGVRFLKVRLDEIMK